MHIPRLHLPQDLIPGQALVLDRQAAHHITRVLRLGPGALLMVFDGQGREHEATLLYARRSGVSIEIGRKTATIPEPQLPITLAQGIPRNDRMDFILQKVVELGISRIQPLWMERSRTRLDRERLEKRLRHWQSVIISACEQSGRASLPLLLPATDYRAWLDPVPPEHCRIMLHPDGTQILDELEPPREEVLLLVGPEGGISSEETRLAVTAGFTPLRLGPRILRTETAAMAAVTVMQTLWGDFRGKQPG